MSMKKIFSRKNENAVAITTPKECPKYTADDVLCDNYALKKFVSDWCDNVWYKFEGFAIFLEGAGINLPVKLSGFDKDNKSNSFKCVDASEKEYIISLSFGDFIDFCSELHVTQKSEEVTVTKIYEISEKHYGEVVLPYMALFRCAIEKNNVKISSFHTRYSCDYTVTVDSNHRLEFNIGRSYDDDIQGRKGEYTLVDDTIYVCKNNDKIHEYLLGYNYVDFNVDELYARLLELLEVKDSGINGWQNINRLWIKYEEFWKDHTKCVQESSRCLAMISVNQGITDRYGYVTPTGEAFWVSNEGDWSYSSENCEISYISSVDKLKYSVEGRADETSKINMVTIIQNVKKEISKMWSKVGL